MKINRKALLISIILLPVVVGIMFSTGRKKQFMRAPVYGKKIGLVRVSNVIYSSESIVKKLEKFRKDKTIAGVIMRVNSPGGGVAPSQEIYEAVKKFSKSGKPIIVSMSNMATSGGYYISAPATTIFANPGTITGSIGVIFQFPQYYKLLDKFGVKMTTIKAGKLKDIGNPNRDITPSEREYLQKLLDNTHMQFIRDVASSRGIKVADLKKIADGRIFTGEQAEDEYLVDTLGSFIDAVAYVKKLSGVSNSAKVIENTDKKELFKELLAENIFDKFPLLNNRKSSPGCYYIFDNHMF